MEMNRRMPENLTAILLVAMLGLLLLGVIPVRADNPPYLYPSQEEPTRWQSDHYVLTASDSMNTKTLTVTSKSVHITNEGTQTVRVSLDGDTVTATTGTRVVADAILSRDFQTRSITYIGVTTHEVTLQLEVNY